MASDTDDGQSLEDMLEAASSKSVPLSSNGASPDRKPTLVGLLPLLPTLAQADDSRPACEQTHRFGSTRLARLFLPHSFPGSSREDDFFSN